MTRDPLEGVAPDGSIVTGVSADRIGPPYDEALAVSTEVLRAALGTDLHSLYLYGSVATGQARPPSSDLDLLAVGSEPIDVRSRTLAEQLSDRFRDVVRGVGISTVVLDRVLAEDREGHTERCFLRHYCVHVAGMDLRRSLPPCRASVDLALGFNGDIGEALARVLHRLEDTEDPGERRRLIAYGARRILMAAATLLSARQGAWTTDRDAGAELLAASAPSLAPRIARVRTWTGLDAADDAAGPATSQAIADLSALRAWLVAEHPR